MRFSVIVPPSQIGTQRVASSATIHTRGDAARNVRLRRFRGRTIFRDAQMMGAHRCQNACGSRSRSVIHGQDRLRRKRRHPGAQAKEAGK